MVSETADFERDLARLVAACETGLDLPGVLAAAAEAAGAALGAGSVVELRTQRAARRPRPARRRRPPAAGAAGT